jgi:uncharacterized protein with HEPN domain
MDKAGIIAKLETMEASLRVSVRSESALDGLTRDSFERSPLHFYAVTRALEIISEASRRLPDDVCERHPHLPWRAIRDVGNFYRHEYDNVLEAYVWETAPTRLEAL